MTTLFGLLDPLSSPISHMPSANAGRVNQDVWSTAHFTTDTDMLAI